MGKIVVVGKAKEKIPPSTHHHLDIADIRDGILLLKDGTHRLIARISPINFALKSETERNLVVEVFKALINSFAHSFQIVVQSRKIDVSEYLEDFRKASSVRGKKARGLAEDDASFIENLVKASNTLKKYFYIIVPCGKMPVEDARKELFLKKRNIEDFLKGLRIGVQALGTDEIIGLFSSLYGVYREEDTPINKFAPSETLLAKDYFRVSNIYTRTLYMGAYPDEIFPGWLMPLLIFDENIDITLHVHPFSSGPAVTKLNRDIRKLRRTISTAPDPSEYTLVAYDDARELREQLVRGSEKIFYLGLYVTVRAPSLEDLDAITKKVSSTLEGMMLSPYPLTFKQETGFKSTSPVGKNPLVELGLENFSRNVTTSCLGASFPFISTGFSTDKGVFYGINKYDGGLVIFDRFSMENANQVILATSGAGKSYFSKLDALRNWLQGVDVIVIDPERDFKRLCQAVGGQYIYLSAKSKDRLNPCDLSKTGEEGELKSKGMYLQALVSLMLGKLDFRQKNELDKAIIRAYRSHGITNDDDIKDPSVQPPLLGDIQEELLRSEITKELAVGLERYIQGSFSGLFDEQTNIDLNNSFVVIDIRDLEDELRAVGMFLALGWVWDIIRASRKKRIVICDEVWQLLGHPDTGKFLFGLAKRARKYWLGLTTITQDVVDFWESIHGKALITNSSMRVLLGQNEAGIDIITEVFKLSEGEKSFLLSCRPGEGLFFARDNHVAMSILASPEEHKLITTKPEEVLELEGENA